MIVTGGPPVIFTVNSYSLSIGATNCIRGTVYAKIHGNKVI